MKKIGSDEDAAAGRFWTALRCLMKSDLLVPVLSIQQDQLCYPLWIFSPGYREALATEHGPIGDLGADLQRAANQTDVDYDNLVITYAIESEARASPGTGIFFCLGNAPKPRLILAPRLHAPTPMNLDGIREAAAITGQLKRSIRGAVLRDRMTA